VSALKLLLPILLLPALTPACAQRPSAAQRESVAERPAVSKNPTYLFRSVSVSEEWDHAADDTLTTSVEYTEPFHDAATAVGVSVPIAKSVIGPAGESFGLGDMSVRGQWIPYETLHDGVLLTGTFTMPTGGKSGGSGKWRCTPSGAYARFWGPRFLLAQFVQQEFSFAGAADRDRINRTDLDLYGVYSSASQRWWINGDVNLRVDEANRNSLSSTTTVSYGRGLRRMMGGSLNGSVQTGFGMGVGRPYSEVVLVSVSLVGFH